MNVARALVLASALFALPAVSSAQQILAYTTNTVLLRAGPAPEYPVVAVLQHGHTLAVLGCLEDYNWCDVVAGPNRGWVHARYIAYAYQGASVPVIDYGSAIGIGIVSFTIGTYWHDHYHARPWYGQLKHWMRRHPRPEGRTVILRPLRHRPPAPAVRVRPPHKAAVRPVLRPAPVVRPHIPRAAAHPRPLQMGIEVRRSPASAARKHSLTFGGSSAGPRMGTRATGVGRAVRDR